MDLGIENRVALVAASSMGLGKAIASQLSREGSRVAICARGEERLLKTRDEIASETGGQVQAFVADVADRNQVSKLVKNVVAELGTVEILVCNAGGPPSGMADEFSLDDYQQALELNLLSTVNLCYEVIPLMKKQKWGRIINMVSISAKQPIENLILSNTARAGVLGFSKSISNQLAPYGVTVNSVCPGYIKTERVENLARDFQEKGQGTSKDFYHSIENTIPLGRLGQPEEIAQAVAFLASERASYITGVALQVDGGYIKALY
ncbi:MAG: SDR family oxidoreductase [Candidatus Aminicenantes bacterium]|nr:SDR family oxidoreductase [Candidatus Aminicenantes bacterium]